MSDKITVTMVETATYQHEYTIDELAELLGISPQHAFKRGAVLAALADGTTDNLDTWLLEDMQDHFQSIEDREWSAT